MTEDRQMSSDLIGISFVDAPPEGMRVLTVRDRHCRFIGMAREGQAICVPSEAYDCPAARFFLGVDTDRQAMADQLVEWGVVADRQAGLSFLERMPRLDRAVRYTAYFPAPWPDLSADLLIAVCSPAHVQAMLRRHLPLAGVGTASPLYGFAAACWECTAYAITNAVPVVSVACNGSRPRIALAEGEMLIAAPRGTQMYDILLGGA